jgi:hypothetical protein
LIILINPQLKIRPARHKRQMGLEIVVATFASYLTDEAFVILRDKNEFSKVTSGGYFIEWDCGADLSAGTIEARWTTV